MQIIHRALVSALSFVFALLPASARIDAYVHEVCASCRYGKIQDALDASRAGDEIRISSGNYKETLAIRKRVKLSGLNFPRIDGGNNRHTVSIHAAGVVLENLEIVGSGASDREDFAGVYIDKASDCRISGNRILGNTYGIYFADAERCVVENNTIASQAKNEITAGNGLHFWKSRDMHIKGNTISGHRDGIYIEFSRALMIERNTAKQNIRYGLHFMYADGNTFLRNTFAQNETGVAIMYSRRIVVSENTFRDNWGMSAFGVLLKDIVDSDFVANHFSENTTGLFADNSNRNRFKKNTFEKNGFALQILGNCEFNEFSENNFRSNFFDVGVNSRENSNAFSKNYWDRYTGYDLNRDGYGDVLFRPVRVFSFWLTKYNALAVLLLSPTLEFLEISERAFPVMTPTNLVDRTPSMRPLTYLHGGIQ